MLRKPICEEERSREVAHFGTIGCPLTNRVVLENSNMARQASNPYLSAPPNQGRSAMRCLRPSIMVLLMLLCRNALHQSHRQNDRQTSSPTGYTVHTFKYHRRHRLKRQPCGILAQRDGRGSHERAWLAEGHIHRDVLEPHARHAKLEVAADGCRLGGRLQRRTPHRSATRGRHRLLVTTNWASGECR